jgi:hypothetical protein
MVSIFKTNVNTHYDAIQLRGILVKEFPGADIRFDFEHRDRIMRIEGKNIPPARIVQIVKMQNYYCAILEEDRPAGP